MLTWIYDHFDNGHRIETVPDNDGFQTVDCFPIYFQEDGHSRTVSGVEITESGGKDVSYQCMSTCIDLHHK